MSERKPRLHVRHDFDEKNSQGLWIRNWMETTSEKHIQHHTRSGSLYDQVVDRSLAGGSAQRANLSYAGTTNGFSGYQEFAEWCQLAPGYLERDHLHRWWVLDKDLIKPNNKCYSPDTCCFIPQRINNLLIASGKIRGSWPIGVVQDKKLGRFRARIRDGTRSMKSLGMFVDPMSAHAAWQIEKVRQLRIVASELPRVCVGAISGLHAHADLIDRDLKMGVETIR